MKLPQMKYKPRILKNTQTYFGGLNHNLGAGDGDLYSMRNLTGDHYPVMATREKRMRYKKVASPGGMFAWDGLAWVDGTGFFYKGIRRGTVVPGEKTFASIGAYIVIFPDKLCYNVDTGELKSMEANWEGSRLTFCDGMLYGEKAAANTIQAEGTDWSALFQAGDAVTISGCAEQMGNNQTIIIRAIEGDKLYFYENSFTLGDGEAVTENGSLAIRRTVPDLKFLCENENRLWGCTDNTIYACKLGDVFNWNVYDGLDTDAYAVDTGSSGAFTGCISYMGYPTFFKEDNIYKVYGSVPSNFEVMGNATLGLAEGCHKSLAVAGETLFYLNRSGVMAYTGGIPQTIGNAFGMERFRNGAAGSDGLKYYISMEALSGGWGLYVYDTRTGLWHCEDESRVIDFAKWDGNLYMLNALGEIWITGNIQDPPEEAELEGNIEWEAEFADFTEGSPNKKSVGKLQLRLELEEGASVKIWILYDGERNWQQVNGALSEGGKRSFYLPVIPRRSDHYRLKLTGTGQCRIWSLTREVYHGSELYRH